MAKKDSLLAHCLARAVIHEQGGPEAAAAKYGPNAERMSKWRATAMAVKVTPKASRVAGFIILWATAMRVEELDLFSITEYQRYWHESERQAYRRQVEFRELMAGVRDAERAGRPDRCLPAQARRGEAGSVDD